MPGEGKLRKLLRPVRQEIYYNVKLVVLHVILKQNHGLS